VLSVQLLDEEVELATGTADDEMSSLVGGGLIADGGGRMPHTDVSSITGSSSVVSSSLADYKMDSPILVQRLGRWLLELLGVKNKNKRKLCIYVKNSKKTF
jgi:hypothetical protein